MDLNKPLTMLKSLIVKTFWDHFMINFNSENPRTYHFVCPCRNCYPNFQIINRLLHNLITNKLIFL